MANKRSRLTDLRDLAARHGLYIYTYSPGDGITRYRMSNSSHSNYFACHALHTALGFSQAQLYVTGFIDGYWNGHVDQGE